MYLRQVTQTGVLGLIGYLALRRRLPAHAQHRSHRLWLSSPSIARSSPGYVSDVLAAAFPAAIATGDIGLMQTPHRRSPASPSSAGGLLFGIALFRASVLARWAAALLAAGAVATIAIPLLPQVNQRLFAIPTGIALIGLGYSLWREQRTPAALPVPSSAGSPLDPAGAK